MMRSKFYLFIKFGYSWLPKSNYILWVYKELLSEYIQFIIMKDLYAIRIAKLKSAIITRALTIIKIKAWLSFSILLWSQISWLKNFLLQEIFSSLFQMFCKHKSMLFHSKLNCQAQFQLLFKLTSTRGWVSLCNFCQAQFKSLFTK